MNQHERKQRLRICPLCKIASIWAIASIAVFLGDNQASAQMFGARTLGSPISRQPRPGAAATPGTEDVGVLSGAERFLRDNRSRDAFVGGGQSSLGGFVGRTEAIGTGRVQAATESLRPETDRSRQINRPLPPLPVRAMYHPQLVIGDSTSRRDIEGSQDSTGPYRQTLSDRISQMAGESIEVVQEGETAILRGEVETREMADRLALVLSFEPQVYQVRSELKVRRN
jgi:hypothetical protein